MDPQTIINLFTFLAVGAVITVIAGIYLIGTADWN